MNLDPDTEAGLRRLLQAETRRLNQKNLEWKICWWFCGIVFGGYALFALLVLFGGSCHSYSGTSPASHIVTDAEAAGVDAAVAAGFKDIAMPILLGCAAVCAVWIRKRRKAKATSELGNAPLLMLITSLFVALFMIHNLPLPTALTYLAILVVLNALIFVPTRKSGEHTSDESR